MSPPEDHKQRLAVTDAESGQPLAPRKQPGYYPGYSTLSQKAYWDATTRDLVVHRVTHPPVLRFFKPAEAITMEAVMDRILPQEDRTPDRRIPLLPPLDHRLYTNAIEGYRYESMPSDQDAYRIAVRAFEEMAQALHSSPYSELGTKKQEEILASVHDGKPLAAEALWKQMSLDRFWTLLVSDCCTAYYAHPWAWDEIGYGGPAYPRGYMRLEEGEPEPWEVDERRYEWNAPADTLSDTSSHDAHDAEHQTHSGQAGTH